MGTTLIPTLSSSLSLFISLVLPPLLDQETLDPIKKVLLLPPSLQSLLWLKLFVIPGYRVLPIYASEYPDQDIPDVCIHINVF